MRANELEGQEIGGCMAKADPKVTVWVSMTDKIMSGWGLAKDKINKLVIGCHNYSEAVIVADNARNRPEMKYVNICLNKPRYPEHSHYVSEHGRDQDDYESWFIQGKF